MRKDTYTDEGVVTWVLDHCKILHLGLADDQGVSYVVPVNFLWLPCELKREIHNIYSWN